MTYSQALVRAKSLKEAMLDHGVERVSIELVEGRGGAGWNADTHIATMAHHIVSRRSQGLTPFLNLCKKGRADLPGPLCNVYGGFDRVARIICMGWANHSGKGGPVTVEKGVIPQNNGRAYFLGTEFEGGLDPDDWRDEDHEFQARVLAAQLDWLGVTEKSHHEHKTWAVGRKSDRLGYTLSQARNEIAKYIGGEMVTRDSKADDGLDIFKRDMEKARSLGFATVHTQPGGVAFNDEIIAILNRAGLLDFKATVQELKSDLAAAHKKIAALQTKLNSISGGGLAPGTTFTAEVQ